jgi:hypothetical protein
MPTSLPRTSITHTPAVERVLALASRRWPHASPRDLLLHVAQEWADQAEGAAQREQAAREQRVRASAGRFTGIYGAGYLDEVREGWPE